MLWTTDDSGAVSTWSEVAAQELADQGCTGSATPIVVERDGQYYPSCSSTGIVFAPPFDTLILADLLFPSVWDVIPPG